MRHKVGVFSRGAAVLSGCMAAGLGAGMAAAADFTPLSGDQIRAILTGKTLDYGTAQQVFYGSGRTLYQVSGRPSWGYWHVEDDSYCSQWPPSDLWACYEVAQAAIDTDADTDTDTEAGIIVRFIGENGDFTDGRRRSGDGEDQ